MAFFIPAQTSLGAFQLTFRQAKHTVFPYPLQFCQLQDAGSCNPACDICNDLVELDCEFNGNIVWESASVVDDTECIQYLNLLSTMYGANYFSFSRETLMCRLFDSPARTCTGMTGVADENLVNSC